MSRFRKTLAVALAVLGLSSIGMQSASARPQLPVNCIWNLFDHSTSAAGWCLIGSQWWWFGWDGSYGTEPDPVHLDPLEA